ncbi:hypothetical protein SADUNF_Sadunf13G0123900 [Salix dunnii]|uniref:Uncharacterized protein n=1 Tax=Salix dunnii TaxID=1413687 RepID=A0A835JHN8_9ROSI|nr:hypothetical protein SADUNF_Sadunf13G0123900 [Salix dunnii]
MSSLRQISQFLTARQQDGGRFQSFISQDADNKSPNQQITGEKKRKPKQSLILSQQSPKKTKGIKIRARRASFLFFFDFDSRLFLAAAIMVDDNTDLKDEVAEPVDSLAEKTESLSVSDGLESSFTGLKKKKKKPVETSLLDEETGDAGEEDLDGKKFLNFLLPLIYVD